MRYAIIDSSTNVVENVCKWSGNTEDWQPRTGAIAVQSDTANLYDLYDANTQTFSSNPNAPTPPPTHDALAQKVGVYFHNNGFTVQQATALVTVLDKLLDQIAASVS
jgi:hypothetical protein